MNRRGRRKFDPHQSYGLICFAENMFQTRLLLHQRRKYLVLGSANEPRNAAIIQKGIFVLCPKNIWANRAFFRVHVNK
jgi:hypothetical protein